MFLFPMFRVSRPAKDHRGISVEILFGVLRMHRKCALKFESNVNRMMNKEGEFPRTVNKKLQKTGNKGNTYS